MSDMYLFTVKLIGYGDTKEDAWDDACEGFIEQHDDWFDVEKNPDDYNTNDDDIDCTTFDYIHRSE